MGILDNGKDYVKRIKDFINEKKDSDNEDEARFAAKLQNELKDKSRQVIWPTELYCRCALTLYENPTVQAKARADVLEYGQHVYTLICPHGEETYDFETLADVFASMFGVSGAIAKTCFNIAVFNLFNDKRNYIKWMQVVFSDVRVKKVADRYRDYGVEARGYFPNEETFTANFIYVCRLMMQSSNPEEVYKVQVRNIEHMAGIYEVDEALIREAEQEIAAAKETVARAKDILNIMDSRTKTIDSVTENAIERIKNVCDNEVEVAKAHVDEFEVNIQKKYNKFIDTQRKSILADKKQLVDELAAESDLQLNEFKKNVRSIVSMAKLDLAKINRESGAVMAKLENYMSDDEKLKGILSTGAEQAEIVKKLEKLTILNDKNIDMLESRITAEAAAAEARSLRTAEAGGQKATAGAPATSGMFVNDDEDPDEIPEINPLLDETVDFKERFAIVLEAKRKKEEKGEHFHRMFDDVLIAIMENANPYLIGPSGCGKTYMVNQIAKILDMSFIDIGYINEEYDILGFQTANGGYSRPNFYRCYKYGKIAFCDELDNGNSRATVKLNSFLSNVKDAGYNFPHGEHVKRHPNFRIIAAGNTSGNGADSVYSTREKIEESVQQRFTPIYVGYDNEVERAILGDYTDWYEFIVLFRNATEEWSQKSHSAAPGIVTTRDAARIKKYLDNESFNMEKIIDYEFIQTKDESYLTFLAEHVKKHVTQTNPGHKISECFIKKVDAIREKDDRRG